MIILNVSRYEEMVQGSPGAGAHMAGVPMGVGMRYGEPADSAVSGEEDKVSQSSTDSSRRLSELPNLEIPQVAVFQKLSKYCSRLSFSAICP